MFFPSFPISIVFYLLHHPGLIPFLIDFARAVKSVKILNSHTLPCIQKVLTELI